MTVISQSMDTIKIKFNKENFMANNIACFLKFNKKSTNKITVIEIFLDQINKADLCMAYRVFASKTKLLFKKQFIFCQNA